MGAMKSEMPTITDRLRGFCRDPRRVESLPDVINHKFEPAGWGKEWSIDYMLTRELQEPGERGIGMVFQDLALWPT